MSVSFCGRREGESASKDRRGLSALWVAGGGSSCHLAARPAPAPVFPFPPGGGSTRRPCGREAAAPWSGQGEMGLSPRRSAQTPPRASPCASALRTPSQNAPVVALFHRNIGEMTVDWVHKM